MHQSEEEFRKDLVRMADYLEGTCHSIIGACERLDLDEGIDWDDKLLDLNIEPCQGCEWWMESCMLEENSIGQYVCEGCMKDDEDD